MKRALLIASPTGGLRGPENDVKLMSRALSRRNFDISMCCGPKATRDGIRSAWQQLIDTSVSGDTVVIYYSGHGGLVESQQSEGEIGETPRRYQFLVPFDQHESTDEDFRGILDVEISHMLRNTTRKTENVTVIFDCCHAGRMARDPTHGNDATPKMLERTQHHNISRYITKLHNGGMLQEGTFTEGNPFAVRIAAAATAETAWEFKNSQGMYIGALTGALVHVLEKLDGRECSWGTVLLQVREMVNMEFPQQHPQLESSPTRLVFSMQHREFKALPISLDGGFGILGAGALSGVRAGNVYAVMPLGSEKVNESTKIATATVENVTSTAAEAALVFEFPYDSMHSGSASAFLVSEAINKWPVSCPAEATNLREALKSSKYLCELDGGESEFDSGDMFSPLAEFKQQGEKLVLYTGRNIEIASAPIAGDKNSFEITQLVYDAEKLARAQHLISLSCERKAHELAHQVDIEFGSVIDERPNDRFRQDGTDAIAEDTRVYVLLKNNGKDTVYANVFNVNVAGNISIVSTSHAEGIGLLAGESYCLGRRQFGRLRGLPVTWPKGISKLQHIEERLVLIISNSPVDLRCLTDSGRFDNEQLQAKSGLEALVHRISNGRLRDMACDFESVEVAYDVHHIPFALIPHIS